MATLISLLMITYLLGWRVLPVTSLTWKINWWAHTLSFYLLLIVIPKSKHLHLVLSPFAIFFRSETTSGVRPLRDDGEDLGMVHFKELAWKDVLDVNACVECGRCTQFCPANQIGGSLSPKEIILEMQHGLEHGGVIIAGTAAEKNQAPHGSGKRTCSSAFRAGRASTFAPSGLNTSDAKFSICGAGW